MLILRANTRTPLLDVRYRQNIGDRAEQQDVARSATLRRGTGVGEPPRRLMMVADGMGGLPGGLLAARAAVRHLPGCVVRAWDPARPRQSQLIGAFGDVQREVADALAAGGKAGGGCALTAAYVRGGPKGIVCFAHMGDVLGLLLRGGPSGYGIAHRTTHHRYSRNRLSRALGRPGADAEVSADILLREGDWIILASDGVGDSLTDPQILRAAGNHTSGSALASALLADALGAATSGRDNATVMVARVGASFLSAAPTR